MALSNGIYYISCVITQTFLQFDNDNIGINTTAWNFQGSKAQQWAITSSQPPNLYSIQNLESQTYAAPSGPPPPGDPWSNVVSASVPTAWFIELLPDSTFAISPDDSFNFTWNVYGSFTANDTPVILFPLNIANGNGRLNISLVPDTSEATTTHISTTTKTTTSSASSTVIPSHTASSTSAGIDVKSHIFNSAPSTRRLPSATALKKQLTPATELGTVSMTRSSVPFVTGVANTGGLDPNAFKSAKVSSPTSATRLVTIGAPVAGGLVALGILILTYMHAHRLLFISGSLGHAVFGWWLFSRRRFLFSCDQDLGQLEISLFLSHQEILQDSVDGSLLIWQVFAIGHSRKSVTVTCPCIRGSPEGQPKLGFGVVKEVDDERRINSEIRSAAPAAWNGTELVHLESETQKTLFKNQDELPLDVALGTYEEMKDSRSIFKPFQRIRGIGAGSNHEIDGDLYAHAFVTHGYRDAQYGVTLVSDVIADRLTSSGIKVTDLKPVSFWHISKNKDAFMLKIEGCLDDPEGVGIPRKRKWIRLPSAV